jgi:hypothetical protein
MSLFNKQITQVLPQVAVGIGAALVTQLAVMAVFAMMRPMAKAAIKGGFVVKDVATGACTLAGSQVEKLTGTGGEVKPLRRLPKPKPGNPSLN